MVLEATAMCSMQVKSEYTDCLEMIHLSEP